MYGPPWCEILYTLVWCTFHSLVKYCVLYTRVWGVVYCTSWCQVMYTLVLVTVYPGVRYCARWCEVLYTLVWVTVHPGVSYCTPWCELLYTLVWVTLHPGAGPGQPAVRPVRSRPGISRWGHPGQGGGEDKTLQLLNLTFSCPLPLNTWKCPVLTGQPAVKGCHLVSS